MISLFVLFAHPLNFRILGFFIFSLDSGHDHGVYDGYIEFQSEFAEINLGRRRR